MQMIVFVAEEADRRLQPLTEWEQRILAVESPEVDECTHERLKVLVGAVILRQRQSGFESDRHSFMSALPWAGEREYPYVVALAEMDAVGSERTIKHAIRRAMPGAWATFVLAVLAAAAIVLVLLHVKH